MLSFPRLSKVSLFMFMCIYTDPPEMHFLFSLKTHCFCLDFCYCFGLSVPTLSLSFFLAMRVSGGLFGSHAVQQLNVSGTAVWVTLKITRFGPGLLLRATGFYHSQVCTSSVKELWHVVFTRLIGQVMSTVTPFNLSISGIFHFDLLHTLKSQAVCWY